MVTRGFHHVLITGDEMEAAVLGAEWDASGGMGLRPDSLVAFQRLQGLVIEVPQRDRVGTTHRQLRRLSHKWCKIAALYGNRRRRKGFCPGNLSSPVLLA